MQAVTGSMIVSRKVLFLAPAILLAALGFAWWAFRTFVPEISLDVEPRELQQRINAKFPYRNCSLVIACIELSNPQLKLIDGSDRLSLGTQLLTNLGPRNFRGSLSFSGKIRYARGSGEFFLDDVQIESFHLESLPAAYAAVIKAQGPAIMRVALQNYPIYRLTGNSTTMSLARLTLKDIKVVNGKLRITLINPLR